MRLLVRVAAAISSMRAPLRPLLANSAVATCRIPAMVRAGSLVRLVSPFESLPATLGETWTAGFAGRPKCTGWFIPAV